MKIYYVSYRPLCYNSKGQLAIKKYGFIPYIDHSIRREPDFTSQYVGISSICRAGKFAPRLEIGDTVIYVTVKGRYGSGVPHWKLVAELEVIEKIPDHDAATEWYLQNNLTIPTNCIVNGSLPLEHDKSALSPGEARLAELRYKNRSKEYPFYIITKALKINLEEPNPIYDDDLMRIFGHKPGTQNPGKIGYKQLKALEALF